MKISLTLRCSLLASGLLLAGAGLLPAASGGTTAAEFLRLGAGRPMGMQDASGSVSRDVTAIYWNPAGLAALDGRDAYFSYRSLPGTVRHDFLGFASPVFRSGRLPGVLGYSLQLLSQDSLEKLDNAGNSAGSFSALSMAHTLAFAARLGAARAGVSVRWIQESIDDTRGGVLAGGFGLQRELGGAASAGFSVENLGPKLRLASESFPLPLAARLGGSYRLLNGDLLLAGDLLFSRGRDARFHAGLEYLLSAGPAKAGRAAGVALRIGYMPGKKAYDGAPGFAAGLGAEAGSFRADLSYQPLGDSGSSLQLGLGCRF